MGYIDKEKMLHDIAVKKGQCLKNGWDMLYASLEETEKYVRKFPEVITVTVPFGEEPGSAEYKSTHTIAEAAADYLRAMIYEKEKEV